MSEKERWIVYPLIFFALGAAIRDKLLQRVESRDIVCESLQIVDSHNPHLPLAILSFDRVRSSAPDQTNSNVGSLQLIDSNSNVICAIDKDAYLESLTTHSLDVVDPHQHVLVKVTTEQAVKPEQSEETADETVEDEVPNQGVIFLNNERVQAGLKIAPPQSREPKPPNEPQPTIEQPETVTPGE